MEHELFCNQHDGVKAIKPKPYDNIKQFTQYNYSMNVPFYITADYECLLKPIQTCSPSDMASYTTKKQSHQAISCVFNVKAANAKYELPSELAYFEHFGEDIDKVFYNRLKEVNLFIAKNYLDKVVPMLLLTEKEKESAAQITTCNICENPLNKISPISDNKINKHKKLLSNMNV
jgi:hypothetical protein